MGLNEPSPLHEKAERGRGNFENNFMDFRKIETGFLLTK